MTGGGGLVAAAPASGVARVLGTRKQKQWIALPPASGGGARARAPTPSAHPNGGRTGPESKMLCSTVTVMPKYVGNNN